MEHPIRERIRLENSWQAERRSSGSAAFFVPFEMAQKAVTLHADNTDTSKDVHVEGKAATHDADRKGWSAEQHLKPGAWNEVAVAGEINGVRLSAAEPLHIIALEARRASDRSLTVRIRLSSDEALESGLLSLFFAASVPDGRQVGAMEITIGRRTRDLSMEMALDGPFGGPCRLKASLCAGDQIVDNARVDVVD